MLQVAGVTKNLLTGNYKEDKNVIQLDAREVMVQANHQLALNVDGDLIGIVPANISILPNHLQFFSDERFRISL